MNEEILEVFSMFILSLWKVYIAYGYFAFKSYNFVVAALTVTLSVISTNLVFYFLYSQIQQKSWLLNLKKSKGYFKAKVFYDKYGFFPSVILAPILLGIPTITLVTLALNENNTRVLIGLVVSSLAWGLLIYLLFYYSLDFFKQYFPFDFF